MSKITDDPIKYKHHIRRLQRHTAALKTKLVQQLDLLDELEAQIELCVGHPAMYDEIFGERDLDDVQSR